MKVYVDLRKCEAHGRCYELATDVFDCRDDGKCIVLAEQIDDQDMDRKLQAESASMMCPAMAISIDYSSEK